MTEQTRKNIYTIVAAVVPILVAMGYLSDNLGKAIIGSVTGILSVATVLLARYHVGK